MRNLCLSKVRPKDLGHCLGKGGRVLSRHCAEPGPAGVLLPGYACMRAFGVRADACESSQARHGATKGPCLMHVDTERARGHMCASGGNLSQEDEVVLFQPAHGGRGLLHASLARCLVHRSQYLACSRVYFTALIHKSLLLSGESRHSVHVLGRAQGLRPRPAEFEDAVVLARLGRPCDTHNATESDSQKKVKDSVVQNVVLGVCIQVKGLQRVEAEV